MKLAIHFPPVFKSKLDTLRAKSSTVTERIRSLLKSKPGKGAQKDKR